MRLAFLGGFGHHYLRGALAANPDWQIAVSGDGQDSEAAKHLGNAIKGSHWFDDPRILLDEFKPDIVSIGAIYALNGELAALALGRDIAVVSDKPIATSWATLERLRELTNGTSRVLLTEFPFRSQKEFRAARWAVQSGQIGEVVLATSQKSYRFGAARPSWYADRELYGGTLLWIASHSIDLIRFCSGVPYKRAIGTGGNISRPNYGTMEDHVAALYELSNGGTAIVHADFLRPQSAPTHGDDRLRIAGSKGVVEVRDGRCLLISGALGERDITNTIGGTPVHEELLKAVRGESTEFYSTQESLEIAAILLQSRDASEGQSWKEFAG
ncbi:Gfo/Idh/MocA family oxidoreductase [bacterium]|nr:MAG: Gfo/Idh/MocA family oxidoreductase [bacterium]